MRARRRVTAVLAAAGAAATAAGCGGVDRPPARQDAPSARAAASAIASVPVPQGRPQAPPPGPPADDLGLPPHVPLRATGAARAHDVRIIRRWLAAQRTGDMRRAARWWLLPSRYQNGTPVITVSVPDERLALVSSFTCGGRLLAAGGSGAFVVVRLRLVRRPGARCGSATGRIARAAIRVGHGRIVEYYRLPADPRRRPPRLAPHPAPVGSGPGAPAA